MLCGFAWNLQSLLLFRILQGLGGGGMVPVSQSILADSFPPEKRGQAFALFGVAVVVAPVVGPTLGGWLSDNCLLALVLPDQRAGRRARDRADRAAPARAATAVAERRAQQQGVRFDVVGFLLVATFLGALEIVLDRGLEDDWFGSSFIVTFTVICVAGVRADDPVGADAGANPMIDVRMVATRQFGACFLVMLATGAILLATTQFLPQLVQQDFGYTATWAGLVLSPGGLVTMVMMFVVGRLAAKNRIASIATFAEYVQDGGLISYGQNLSEHYRRGAIYVDKILNSADARQFTRRANIKLELVINRKTARMLGLALPESLMISADKVIE